MEDGKGNIYPGLVPRSVSGLTRQENRNMEYFSLGEAESLVGKAIRTLVSFCDVPEGSHGRVIGLWKANPRGYGVDIRWRRFDGDKLIDGFSKRDFELFLEMI